MLFQLKRLFVKEEYIKQDVVEKYQSKKQECFVYLKIILFDKWFFHFDYLNHEVNVINKLSQRQM